MERNDIELIRRWAGEISDDKTEGLETKLAIRMAAADERMEIAAVKVQALVETVKVLAGRVSELEKPPEKFKDIKNKLTRKPKPKTGKEKAIAAKVETR
jgi:hypothetical protein